MSFQRETGGDREVSRAAGQVACLQGQPDRGSPTSGLGSSRSVLLGCMFCAMTMRASRSDVVSVLAFRLRVGGREESKTHFSHEQWSDNQVHWIGLDWSGHV